MRDEQEWGIGEGVDTFKYIPPDVPPLLSAVTPQRDRLARIVDPVPEEEKLGASPEALEGTKPPRRCPLTPRGAQRPTASSASASAVAPRKVEVPPRGRRQAAGTVPLLHLDLFNWKLSRSRGQPVRADQPPLARGLRPLCR